jgi:hypothetical protein
MNAFRKARVRFNSVPACGRTPNKCSKTYFVGTKVLPKTNYPHCPLVINAYRMNDYRRKGYKVSFGTIVATYEKKLWTSSVKRRTEDRLISKDYDHLSSVIKQRIAGMYERRRFDLTTIAQNFRGLADILYLFLDETHKILSVHEAAPSKTVLLDKTYKELEALSLEQDELLRQALRCVQNTLYQAAHILAWISCLKPRS